MKFKKEIIHKLTKIDKKKKKHSSFFLPEHQRCYILTFDRAIMFHLCKQEDKRCVGVSRLRQSRELTTGNAEALGNADTHSSNGQSYSFIYKIDYG